MKKISPRLLGLFVAFILITFLFGCARWNQAKFEQEFGPPPSKEIVDGKTIYHYYYFGRGGCVDLTFDKDGKLINRREYYGESCNKQVDSWLKISEGERPRINITGKWHDTQGSGFFGWGEGYLRQEKNRVTGAIGGYDIKGVVSGKVVHLIFLSGGIVYYTARLEIFEDKDLLMGDYSGGYMSRKGNLSLERDAKGR